MKNLRLRLAGLKIAAFLLSIITLGIPSFVKFLNTRIEELSKLIDDEIKKEETSKE